MASASKSAEIGRGVALLALIAVGAWLWHTWQQAGQEAARTPAATVQVAPTPVSPSAATLAAMKRGDTFDDWTLQVVRIGIAPGGGEQLVLAPLPAAGAQQAFVLDVTHFAPTDSYGAFYKLANLLSAGDRVRLSGTLFGKSTMDYPAFDGPRFEIGIRQLEKL